MQLGTMHRAICTVGCDWGHSAVVTLSARLGNKLDLIDRDELMIHTKRTHIEPELLFLFSLTNGLLLLLFGSELIGWVLNWNPFPTPWYLVNTSTAVVILAYLYSGWWQRRMGWWYLPVGLLIASIGPIIAQWAEIAWRINQDVPRSGHRLILALVHTDDYHRRTIRFPGTAGFLVGHCFFAIRCHVAIL